MTAAAVPAGLTWEGEVLSGADVAVIQRLSLPIDADSVSLPPRMADKVQAAGAAGKVIVMDFESPINSVIHLGYAPGTLPVDLITVSTDVIRQGTEGMAPAVQGASELHRLRRLGRAGGRVRWAGFRLVGSAALALERPRSRCARGWEVHGASRSPLHPQRSRVGHSPRRPSAATYSIP